MNALTIAQAAERSRQDERVVTAHLAAGMLVHLRASKRRTLTSVFTATLLLAGCSGGGGAATVLPVGSNARSAAPLNPASTTSAPPGAAASSAPAALTTASTQTASAYASIVNGQPWPVSFRPYGNQVWNTKLPATPQNLDAANSGKLRSYLVNPAGDGIATSPNSDYSHPIYYASGSDPSVAIDCGAATYGCSPSSLPSFHIPAKARPAGGSDHHLAVIQPNGDEFDLWYAHDPGRDWQNGDTISTAIAVQTSVFGNGVPQVKSATSGAALAAGLIRFDELVAGTIPHALFLVLPCTTGHEFPGTTDAMNCADGGGVPVGAQIYLALSDAQIDALPTSTVPAALRPIAHALHQYGGFVEDTGGSSSSAESAHGPFTMYESVTQYAAMGAAYPGIAFAQAHGYAFNASAQQWSGPGLNWPALAPYLKVLAPCYAAGACTQ